MLKLSCQYLYDWLRYRLNKEDRPIAIMPTHTELTQVPMMFLMYWVDPKDHILKVLCRYIYYWLRYRLNKEKRPIVIIPTRPKLTQVTRVIHEVLDAVGRPQGSFAESFVSIVLFYPNEDTLNVWC